MKYKSNPILPPQTQKTYSASTIYPRSVSALLSQTRNHRSSEHVGLPIKSSQAENNLISSLLQIALFNSCRVSLPFYVGARRGLIENCWFIQFWVFGTEMRQLLPRRGGGVWEGGDEASQEEFWVGLEFLMVWINGFDEILGDC
jgi:hypothetical protein